MDPGCSSSYGLHWPQTPSDAYGFPNGWQPIPDMPAPPGMQWGTFEAGGGGWGSNDGWGNGYGEEWGYDNNFGGGGGWGGADVWGAGGGGGGGGGGWPSYGNAWPGPHGRNHWGNDRYQQWGPGGYANSGMNYSGDNPIDDGIPGINLKNSRGGIGAEAGYDYLYPSEHTKVHVLFSKDPPWHNDGRYHMRTFHVPCNSSTKELMQQFGCDNDDKEKNAVIELAQGSDGRWFKGLVLQGSNKDMMKKSLGDIGWNKDRGIKEDVVYCWFTKDYKPNE